MASYPALDPDAIKRFAADIAQRAGSPSSLPVPDGGAKLLQMPSPNAGLSALPMPTGQTSIMPPSNAPLQRLPMPASASSGAVVLPGTISTLAAPSVIAGNQNNRLPMPLGASASTQPSLLRGGPLPIPDVSGTQDPSATTPAAGNTSALQTRLTAAQNEQNRLRASGSGISQIGENVDPSTGAVTPGHLGFWKGLGKVGATVGDDLLRIAAPNVEMMIPGGYGHHQVLLAQQHGIVASDQDQLQAAAQLSDTQGQALQHQFMAQQEAAKAYALTHAKPSKGQLLYDKNGTPIGFQGPDGSYMGANDPNLPSGVGEILGAAARKQPTSAFELWQTQNPKGTAEDYLKLTSEGKVKTLPEQYNEALASNDDATAQRILKVIKATSTDPKVTVINAGAAARVAGQQLPNLGSGTGEAYLSTLPPQVANLVRSTANGDIAIPPAGSRAPGAQAMRQAVLSYDPTFTDARYKGKQQFKTGPDANSIVQLSTALEHLESAKNNSAAVGLAPMLGMNATANDAKYNKDIQLFTEEVGKLVKNGVVTKDEFEQLVNGLNSSRQGIRDASIDELTNLMGGKVQGLFQKYKTATDQDLPVNEFFDPKTQGRLAKYGIVQPSQVGSGPAQVVGGAPQRPANVPANYLSITDSQGQQHWLPPQSLAAAKQRDPGLKVSQ
jgi:hypothetical protein